MIAAARLSAAMEVLSDIDAKNRPASDSLKDWGQAHRFAGSKDRGAVATLVYDALRRRSSSAWVMGDASPRAAVLGALVGLRGIAPDAIASLFSGERHAPAELTEDERRRLAHPDLAGAPAHVRGDYPEWLAPSFEAAFGEAAVAEGEALSRRAPLDLRVNTLKASRDKAVRLLAHLRPEPTRLSRLGLRLMHDADGRGPSLQGEPAYLKGRVEIQDEGSQVAALLAGGTPGQQVLDLCAGGGGKTLALAAAMENTGQIYATDPDGHRLAPIFRRLERAGARNVQVRAPRGATDVLADLAGRCDLVLVDAPCTGTGAWRRNPDAKWRMRPGALAERLKQQDQALDRAVTFVKPKGRVVYVTCSVLREENEDRIAGFLERHAGFQLVAPAELVRAGGVPLPESTMAAGSPGLRLSPHTTATDGFFIAALRRSGS